MSRDKATYYWAGVILKLGMYISFSIMLIGLIWSLIANAGTQNGLNHKAVPLDKLIAELIAGNPLAIISTGVVLLLLTPGVTLLSLIITYAAAKNWRFAGIAFGIGLILLLGLSISLKWIKLL
ncbi:MAG: DUF1634 domain-containing protein [Chloroflexia bacterium]